jgi:hypothetical protein
MLVQNRASGGSGGTGGSDGQGVGVGVYLAAGGNVSILDSSIAGNYASTSDDDVFGSFGP